MQVEFNIRILNIYIRSFAVMKFEIIYNRVLHFLGHELRMAEPVRIYRGIDGKGLVNIHIFVPRERKKLIVEAAFVPGFESEHRNHYFERSSGGIINLVKKTQIAFAVYRAVFDLNVLTAQFFNFFCQYFFESEKSFNLYL